MSKKEGKLDGAVEEFCVVNKEVAIARLNYLLEKYKDVFEEYNMWVNIINSQVNLIKEDNLIQPEEA